MSNHGKTGRRLRRIAELEKIQHPGEMSEELKAYVDRHKGYSGVSYDRIKDNELSQYWKAVGDYDRAQDEIRKIKINLAPESNFSSKKLKPYTDERIVEISDWLNANAEINGEP